MTLQLELLTHAVALEFDRLEPAPEADHVLHPALRFGWLWRSTNGAPWKFTSTISERGYPENAMFVQVYVPVVPE